MRKYFKTNDELTNYILEKFYNHRSIDDMLCSQGPSDEEVINRLLEDGYTDLNNLTEDGHAYQIGEYTNHGWLYEDEADIGYIEAHGIQIELRKR